MNNNKVLKDAEDFKQRDNYIKQQQQLKAMNPTGISKVLSADSMIEDLLSKKETFQKKVPAGPGGKMQTGPPWIKPDNIVAVHPLYTKIWEMVRCPTAVSKQTPELADTSLVSSLLMTSGLSTDMLGFIWGLVNTTVPGALTQPEFYSVLALVALAQSGYIFNSVAVLNNLPQPPIPNLNLSVLVQLKTGFNGNISTVQSPTGLFGNVCDVKSTSGNSQSMATSYNYFSDFQTATEMKKANDTSIVPLDVNNLQSASTLTLPSSLVYSHVYSGVESGEQEFAAFQSAPPPSVEPAPIVAGVTPMHTYQSAMQPVVNSAIPSISLGISLPQTAQSTSSHIFKQHSNMDNDDFQQQSASQGSNVAKHLSYTFSGDQNNSRHLFQETFAPPSIDVASNFLKLNLDDTKSSSGANKETTVTENTSNTTSEAFNVDQSFDSLFTERAAKQTSQPDGHPELQKPNYNINLFDSYSDVKSIFPTGCDESDPNPVGAVKDITHVTHNPLFDNDDDDTDDKHVENSFASMNIVNKSNIMEDDDFTDFQSADFTTFNNKVDEFSNFTDFQQASVPVTSLPDSKIITSDAINVSEAAFLSSKSSSDYNDEDLFPSINLQLDGGGVAGKLAEPSDSLSIKSIDISIISSGRDTRANSSPVSSDYECQENKKEPVAKESSDFSLEGFKDDKTFLSLSSSIVFDSNNSSVVPAVDMTMSISNDVSQPMSLQTSTSGSGPFDATSPLDDKYSALRMLEVSSNENQHQTNDNDFGDFVAANADPLELPHVSEMPPQSLSDNRSSEVKCLEACASILEKSYDILKSISAPTVLHEILSDPRGTMHISCLLEVYRVSERLMQDAECKSTPLIDRVQLVWNKLIQLIPDDVTSYNKQLEENLGPKCGVCKCNYGPTPVRYGLNYYHPPCANLYLRYVSPLLPSIPI